MSPCCYADYPKNWKTEIRPAILKRAKNKCEECGVENGAIGMRDSGGRFSRLEGEGESIAAHLDGDKIIRIGDTTPITLYNWQYRPTREYAHVLLSEFVANPKEDFKEILNKLGF